MDRVENEGQFTAETLHRFKTDHERYVREQLVPQPSVDKRAIATETPATASEPTDGQRGRGQRLAYVSFSRALEDLRVLLFTADPGAARQELIDKKLLAPEQIEIVAI